MQSDASHSGNDTMATASTSIDAEIRLDSPTADTNEAVAGPLEAADLTPESDVSGIELQHTRVPRCSPRTQDYDDNDSAIGGLDWT